MTQHITDEQIEQAYEAEMRQSLRPQDRATVVRVCRAVLALAAPLGAVELLREFSEAMSDAGDWPDTYDERERLKVLVDRVRFYLEPVGCPECRAAWPAGTTTCPKCGDTLTDIAPAVPSDELVKAARMAVAVLDRVYMELLVDGAMPAFGLVQARKNLRTALTPPVPPQSPATQDQPAPEPNDERPAWELVIEDMKARDNLGRARYGTPLQPNNGRDNLVDAYQEVLDLAVYLRCELEARKKD